MLQQIKQYNNLSPELRARINKDREIVGDTVKYKFYIAKKNPDGQRLAAGEYLYPAVYTLSPVTYNILDPGDKIYKLIGMATGITKYGEAEEVTMARVSVTERQAGILTLDLKTMEHAAAFEYLQMHPKFEGGMFRDKNIPAMFARVDDLKEARTKLKQRELRSTALQFATRMQEKDVRDFAAAMNWNELEDLDMLRDKLTDLADKDPVFFQKFIDDPLLESKAVVRRALDANIIAWIPVENKFVWVSNGTTIAMLERGEGDEYMDKMAHWFRAHKNGDEVYKKMKQLLSGK